MPDLLAWERLYHDSIRQIHATILGAVEPRPGGALLDLGCDDGALTVRVGARAGVRELHGVEVNDAAVTVARGRGVLVVGQDLGEPWPYPDDRFDVVHANQVIEHVAGTDHFMREVGRVLAPDGYALICTNNLGSWHNVLSLTLGYQPQPCHVSDEGLMGTLVGGGIGTGPHAHLRVLTERALVALAHHHGLTVEVVRGIGWYPLTGRVGRLVARLDHRHAAYVLIRLRHADVAR